LQQLLSDPALSHPPVAPTGGENGSHNFDLVVDVFHRFSAGNVSLSRLFEAPSVPGRKCKSPAVRFAQQSFTALDYKDFSQLACQARHVFRCWGAFSS